MPINGLDGSSSSVRVLPVFRAGEVDVPFVISGMYESIAHDTEWAEHSHPTHELLWNKQGASTARVGPKTWMIAPSVGLWVPAGVMHSGHTPAGTVQYAAQFSIDDVPSISDEPVAVDVDPLLRMLLERLCLSRLEPGSRVVTEAMVLDLLAPSTHEVVLCMPTSSLLGPIVRCLDSDPGDATTLAEWSIRLGVSSRTLARAFVSETGVGFARWVTIFRVQRAIILLNSGETVEDTARCVGFHSASSFGSAFRRVTGLSPGQYRSQ